MVLRLRAGPTGRLYGAVTNAMLAEELTALMEVEIDRRNVALADTIHEPGEYQATVRLHPDLTATVNFAVEPLQ